MASDAKPKYPEILELPPVLTVTQFQALVNDRIRDLNILLRGVAFNPAVTDLDMANFRIVSLADPTDDLDAVNLRTLRRQGGGSTAVATPAATTSSTGAYTIVFNVPGFLGPDEQIPAYVVGLDREGSAAESWIYALGSPSPADFTYQITQNGASILAAPATLSVGSNGPNFVTAFTGKIKFKHGDVIELVPVSGTASGISVGLVVVP